MLASTTRATRSRFSSPAQPQNPNWNGLDMPKGAGSGSGTGTGTGAGAGSAVSGNEGSRAFMQRWLEPTVQSKASFEDDGLMRYGVVENMAPLGAMPKKTKAANEPGSSTVRKIILRHSAAGLAARDAAAEPAAAAATDATAPKAAESTINAEPAPKKAPRASLGAVAATAASSSPSPVQDEMPLSPPRRKSLLARDADADDDDYDPREGSRRRQSARANHSKKARRSSGARRSSVTVSKAALATPKTPAMPAVPDTPVKMEPDDKELVDKVVEAAVEEALKHYRYPTAWALRTLYDERSGDLKFVAMIEDVFNQTADAATMRKFSKLMEAKKREGKKDNQGCYYFVPPSTNSRFTPHKPKAAPYAKLVQQLGAHSPTQEEEEQPTPAQPAAQAQAQTQTQTQTEAQSHDHPPATRSAKKPKSSHHHHTPRKMASTTATNGDSIKTPSRKRQRRDSASSDSSLSSAISLSSPEESARDRDSASTLADHEGSRSPTLHRAAAAGRAPAPAAGKGSATGAKTTAAAGMGLGLGMAMETEPKGAPKARPITTRGSKTKKPRSSPSGSNSPTLATSSTNPPSSKSIYVEPSMPGKVIAGPLFPNLPTKGARGGRGHGRQSLNRATARQQQHQADEDINDDQASPFWEKRRAAQRVTNSVVVQESSVRGRDDDGDGEEEEETTPTRKSGRRTRQSIAPPVSTRATRSNSKRPHDEIESTVSPVAFSFQGDGSSTIGSRAATPTTLRPAKRQRTGLRVKSSPVKKKGGTAAGLPRSMVEAHTAATNGASRDQVSDNDEYCSSCGNAGDVVCCDGCPRSFHFECVDMVQSESLPDEWFCNECLYRRYPARMPPFKGAFAAALHVLEKTNSRAFSLPKKLQTRFEGVKVGSDGEYEEVSTTNKTRRKTGYEEVPDFFKQRDDGKAVLCHGCQTPATDVRAIIPCSVCPLYWHIDCLDPPLAVPPVLKTWRCPAHVDDVLNESHPLAPAHRFRVIKGGQSITPSLSRGLKNNGYIEVDWAGEPEVSNKSGWQDPESFGRGFKLPAQGIVLDFIEQLRRKGAGFGPRRDEQRWLTLPSIKRPTTEPIKGSAWQRSVDEVQASLTLAALKDKQEPTGIDQLTSALLSSMDQPMLAMVAKSNADSFATGHLTENDKMGLRALLAQMTAMTARVREVLGEDAPPAGVAEQPELRQAGTLDILSPNDSATTEPHEKVAAPPPVTEPTPPSTIDHAETEGAMDLD